MASWSCPTNHASTLLCIAHDPGVRVHDIAVEVDTTERSAHGIVADLVDAGYLVKLRRRPATGSSDNLPNGLAARWWACPAALGHSGPINEECRS